MVYDTENVKKIAELNSLFLNLNDIGQDSALTILRSLRFAQLVMCSPKTKNACLSATEDSIKIE